MTPRRWRTATRTTFYRFGESGNGAQEEAVSFHCIPRERDVAGETTLTLDTVSGDTGGLRKHTP